MKARRIQVVFAICCGLVAVIAGFLNLNEVYVGAIGADGLSAQARQQPSEFLRRSMQPQIEALGSKTYRWALLAQGAIGLVAAGSLLFGAWALLTGHRLWRKLVLGWGLYGLAIAPVSATLSALYIVPGAARHAGTSATVSVQVFAGLFFFCIFLIVPGLILLSLLHPALRQHRGRVAQRASWDTAESANPPDPVATGGDWTLTSFPKSRAQGALARARPAATLRDDPWNDPSAT